MDLHDDGQGPVGPLPARCRRGRRVGAAAHQSDIAAAVDTPAARDLLKRAIACLEELGHPTSVAVRCTLAAAELVDGRLEQAEAAVAPALVGEADLPAYDHAACHAVFVGVAAGREDWSIMAHHLEQCERVRAQVPSGPLEHALVQRRAGEHADRPRERHVAVRAWTLAHHRLVALGARANAHALMERISSVTLT